MLPRLAVDLGGRDTQGALTFATRPHGGAAREPLYCAHAILAVRSRAAPAQARAVPPDPGAQARAERDHAARAVRRPDRHPARARRPLRAGARRDRVRRDARRGRRARRAHDQGHVALRRRARQPRGLLQFRRRARPDPVFLGPERARQSRLDRRDGVRDLRRAAACALQRADRGPEPPGLGRQLLHRRSGAGRRHRGAAADLSRLPPGERAGRSSR